MSDGVLQGSGSGKADDLLVDIYERPCLVERPAEQRVPFVFALPHSGRTYPRTLFQRSRLSRLSIRRSEDAYVDELLRGVPHLGAPMVMARFPRAYLDANRAPGELDPSMFDGPLRIPVDAAGPRVAAGLGVIPRIVRDGAEIYRAKLPPDEAEKRLLLHRKYHEALSSLLRESYSRFGTAVVIDCHSMPSAAGTPDVVLGDRYGTAASHTLLRHAEQAFRSEGFRIGHNVPYAGGYTTHIYGEPKRGIHALQVEINRALYLDEERIELTANYLELKRRLTTVILDLLRLDPGLLRPRRQLRMAAE